jgi:hypothetical protein
VPLDAKLRSGTTAGAAAAAAPPLPRPATTTTSSAAASPAKQAAAAAASPSLAKRQSSAASPAPAAAAPAAPTSASDPVCYTLSLPPEGRPFYLCASDIAEMGRLRELAGAGARTPGEFAGAAIKALLSAAASAPVPRTAGESERRLAAASVQRARRGDRGTPILYHAFIASLAELLPGGRALSPAQRVELSKGLSTLFLLSQDFESTSRAEGEASPHSLGAQYDGEGSSVHAEDPPRGVPASELATTLLFLCSGSKTDKLSCAFSLADADGDGALSARQLSSLLRGLLVGLAGVRSEAHMDRESAEETAGIIALPECASEIARRIIGSAAPTASALGSISFQELCDHYNKGGALGALGFLELLDFRKVRGLVA